MKNKIILTWLMYIGMGCSVIVSMAESMKNHPSARECILGNVRRAYANMMEQGSYHEGTPDMDKYISWVSRQLDQLHVEDWPASLPFTESIKLEKILQREIDSAIGSKTYTSMGSGKRVQWQPDEASMYRLTYAFHPSTLDAQVRFIELLLPSLEAEYVELPDYPEAIVARGMVSLIIAYRNYHITIGYNEIGTEKSRMRLYTEEDFHRVMEIAERVLKAIEKIPVNDKPLEFMQITPDPLYLSITGEDQYVFFNIPEELAEYEISVDIPEGDFTVRDRTDRISPRQSRWTGRPVKPGTALFNVRGVGPYGELLRQQIAIEIKGDALENY